ncbi:LptM family lipoprotein [Loigolactobacillus zhaoyuanensis]|uniref:Lipoprotein n=1 Tax=Loigolactobacillus zhaoyuanensis TaxID=2486017 RepID=A0ABW8UDH9_9LACO
MKKLFGVLLVGITAVTLAGCGASNSSTQKSASESSQSTSQSNKRASAKASTKAKKAKAISASTSNSVASVNANSAATASSSVAASQPAQNQTATTVSGQNLTTAQVQAWVAQNISGNYQAGDLAYTMNKNENGELVIQVQENHNSANAQVQGADANTAPTIGWFKINQQGQLLSSPDAGASWNVVSNSYQ